MYATIHTNSYFLHTTKGEHTGQSCLSLTLVVNCHASGISNLDPETISALNQSSVDSE